MKQKRVSGLDFRRLWLESGEVLAENSNRLTLILALMVAACPLMLYLSVLSVFRLAVFPLFSEREFLGTLIAACSLLALSLFITLPLWTGLLWMAKNMETGKATPLTEIFYAFSNQNSYGKALKLSRGVLWRISLLIAEEWVATLFVKMIFGETVLGSLLGIPIYLAIFVAWFFFAVRSFLKPCLAWQIPDDAPRMCPYARSVGTRYCLGFFPWIVLSLMTFGILLLADTLPRMLIAYFRLCRKLNEFTTPSED